MSSLSQNLSASADAVPDTRLSQLNEWLATTGLVDVASGRRASVDASFRRYFRYDVVADMQDKLGATLVDIDTALETCGVLIVLVDHDVFRVVPLEERSRAAVYDTRGIWPDQPRQATTDRLRLAS